MIDLDKLQAAAEAATPGPWTEGLVRVTCDADNELRGAGVVRDAGGGIVFMTANGPEILVSDAEFIAAANPAIVLALIEQIRATEVEVLRPRERQESHDLANEAIRQKRRANAALARIATIEALHESAPVHLVASDGATVSRLTCLHCSRVQAGEFVQPGEAYVWPCPTVRVLTEGENE